MTPITIEEAIRQSVRAFNENDVPAARLTADVLLSHVLGKERSFLYSHPEYELTPAEQERWQDDVRRRCEGEPTQYITGRQEFYGFEFKVRPGVFIPRPETELLVEEALARAAEGGRVLDVGAGSGCIGIAIKKSRPDLPVFAGDISSAALAAASENARRLSAEVRFIQMDLVKAISASSLAVAVCNPPYVPLAALPGLQRELRFEPSVALFGGEQGLDVYRRLIPAVHCVLQPGGWLLLELGYNSRSTVEQMLDPAVWDKPMVRPDLAGIDRVLAVRKR